MYNMYFNIIIFAFINRKYLQDWNCFVIRINLFFQLVELQCISCEIVTEYLELVDDFCLVCWLHPSLCANGKLPALIPTFRTPMCSSIAVTPTCLIALLLLYFHDGQQFPNFLLPPPSPRLFSERSHAHKAANIWLMVY